jgi:predicted Rossmann fold nucleotide-binding protein DprA/Smf involved in DNA uptake
VLDALGWQPATLEDVVARAGLEVAAVAVELVRLEHDGWLESRSGWFERRDPGAPGPTMAARPHRPP